MTARQSLRFLVVNAYSAANAGDAAINVATAALLSKRGSLTIASRYATEDAEFYARHDIAVVPAPVPFPTRGESRDMARFVTFLLGSVVALFLACLFRVMPRAGLRLAGMVRLQGMTALLSCDRVVMSGGGYLYSARRRLNLTLVHAAVTSVVARLAGIPLGMMPQSIGPLTRPIDRWLVRMALGGASTITVRDEASALAVTGLAVQAPVELVPDVAFALRRAQLHAARTAARGDAASGAVALVCMDWTWARPVGRDALRLYVGKLAETAAILAGQGCDVILTGMSRVSAHDQDDFQVADLVQSTATRRGITPPVVRGETFDEVAGILGSARLVVGTRLHSCIIAMALGVPAIAIGYQPKTLGTYRLLDLPELCFDVETFSAHAVAARAAEIASDRATWVGRIADRVAAASISVERVAERLSGSTGFG